MTIRGRAAVVAVTAAAGFAAATGVAGAQSSSPAAEVLEVRGEVLTQPVALPRTGSDLGLVAVGAGLAGAGIVLVVAARRRQSPSAS